MTEPEAFARIFDRHWPAIHRFCTSRAAGAGEDLAAEVFRVALDRRRHFDVAHADAAPWLHGIATNLLRRHFRTAGRGRAAAARLERAVEPDPADEALGRVEAAALGPRLAAALADLGAADRDALLLHAWAGLSYEEIALATGVPIGTVRSRIHRGRTRLRAHRAPVHSAGREVAVAAAAASPALPVEEARERMVRATWAPATPLAAAPGPVAAPSAAAQAQQREKLAATPEVPAASQQALDENRVWMGCMDALLAGAGRRDVRAGALRILASVASVTVGPATVNGTAVLQLTSTGFGDGYRETLSIDSGTGVPIRFEGGHPGAEPSVVMDYEVARVTAAEV